MSGVIGAGVFKKLEGPPEFLAASSDGFTMAWSYGLDIAPEELYENRMAPLLRLGSGNSLRRRPN